jgi:hypothetical protein
MLDPERRDTPLRFSVPASNAAKSQADEVAFGWIGKSPRDVGRSDPCEAARERRHTEHSGVFGEIVGDLFWDGGNAPSPR